MEMTNLRENIVKYRETKDKKILKELYTYFLSYIKNIGKKIYYEYKETDLVTKFIEVINKLDIREGSNDQIQGKIVNSLKKKRADIVKESIKEKVQHPYFLQDLKIDIEERKDMYLNILIKDLLDKLSERERMILELSFFEDRTDIYIGELLDVSSARIGQIKKLALNKLKKELMI